MFQAIAHAPPQRLPGNGAACWEKKVRDDSVTAAREGACARQTCCAPTDAQTDTVH